MPLFYENTKVGDLYIGSTKIALAYCGNKLVYAKPITFSPSNELQTLVVPQNVNKIHVDCVASKGNNGSTTAGNGGRVQCDLSVTSGQTLYIMVGGIPADSRIAEYNASDIRTNNAGITDTTSLQSRLVVAGAGGSGPIGSNYPGNGGQGGGLVGGNGTGGNWGTQGYGGTQTSGGSTGSSSGGTVGQNGTFGMGGNGNYAWAGGAGGAGWYGGGGAGNYGTSGRTSSGGGGGGSSYTDENLCSNVIHTQGYNDGAGYITISFVAEV